MPNRDKELRPSSANSDLDKSMEEEEDEDLRDVPKHLKSYSVKDQDIFYEKAKRMVDTHNDGVHEGLMKVKEVNLAKLGESPKLVFCQ